MPGFPDSARLEVGGGLPAWRGGFVSELPLAQKGGRRAGRHVDGAAQPKIRHSDRPPLFAVGSGRLCYSEFYFFKLAGGPDWTVCSGGRRHAGNHFRTDLWTMKSGSPNCSTTTYQEWGNPFEIWQACLPSPVHGPASLSCRSWWRSSRFCCLPSCARGFRWTGPESCSTPSSSSMILWPASLNPPWAMRD